MLHAQAERKLAYVIAEVQVTDPTTFQAYAAKVPATLTPARSLHLSHQRDKIVLTRWARCSNKPRLTLCLRMLANILVPPRPGNPFSRRAKACAVPAQIDGDLLVRRREMRVPVCQPAAKSVGEDDRRTTLAGDDVVDEWHFGPKLTVGTLAVDRMPTARVAVAP